MKVVEPYQWVREGYMVRETRSGERYTHWINEDAVHARDWHRKGILLALWRRHRHEHEACSFSSQPHVRAGHTPSSSFSFGSCSLGIPPAHLSSTFL